MATRSSHTPQRGIAASRLEDTDISDDSQNRSISSLSASPPANSPVRRRSAAQRRSTNVGESGGEQHHIPAPLLTRICQEQFEHSETKIAKEARILLSKYMDTFIREALARAKHEMDQKKSPGLAREFLEVEDLEKLAPQLLLDF